MGVIVNLAEFPAVAAGNARFRMQVMAPHTEAQTVEGAHVVADAVTEARDADERSSEGAST